LEQILKNCSPWEGPTLEQFMKDCMPWERLHAGAGEKCEEEGAAEPKCYELTTDPHSASSLSCLGRKEVQESQKE